MKTKLSGEKLMVCFFMLFFLAIGLFAGYHIGKPKYNFNPLDFDLGATIGSLVTIEMMGTELITGEAIRENSRKELDKQLSKIGKKVYWDK